MTSIAPVDSQQRIGELDVLRGFALLGVFIVHFVGAAFYTLPLDDAIAETWQAEPWHFAALFITDTLFYDKANTLFATLFGMGFWLMLERLRASGRNFERLYVRRLLALLVLGLANLFLIFPGDVLHEYALLGLLLFLLRGLAAPWMLWLGLFLALLGDPLLYHLLDVLGLSAEYYDKRTEAAFAHGGYLSWVVGHADAHVTSDILNGMLLGWAAYIFGRFLLGAWILRKGLIQQATRRLQLVRRVFPRVLLSGIGLEAVSMAVYMGVLPLPMWSERALHLVGAPVLAVGYALGLILLFNSDRWRDLAGLFAPVGRIALTAYVGHGALFTLLYFPFGMNQLGTVSPAVGFMIALVVFGAFTVFAHFWLRSFRFGPLEYLWRWATYGTRPLMRRRATA
jgi:uncharacterized protein